MGGSRRQSRVPSTKFGTSVAFHGYAHAVDKHVTHSTSRNVDEGRALTARQHPFAHINATAARSYGGAAAACALRSPSRHSMGAHNFTGQRSQQPSKTSSA